MSILIAAGFALPLPAGASVNVVTTIKPVHALVAAVMKGVGQPYLIVKGGSSPHTYALRPSDAAALQGAAVVFWVGPSLETFLETGLPKLGASARIVELGTATGIVRRTYRRGADWHDDHDHGSGGHGSGGHEAEEHTHDPHVWLDPVNAEAIVLAAARALAAADPGRRDLYNANAAATVERLRQLKSDLERRLAALRGRNFFVFHDAYVHLEDRFRIPAAGAISLGNARAPGARHLRKLRKRIAQRKIACVFSEPQFEPKLVRTLIAGTSVRTGTLDPLGADLPAGPDLYFTLMARNAAALEACLGDNRT